MKSVSGKMRRKIVEPVALIIFFGIVFGYMGYVMGAPNMFNTMMNTSYHLLLETVLYLMGITVLTGAFGRLLVEFGVIAILEKLLRPLMRPLYNLPGVAALGAVMTFVSDNPAIISLSKDARFSSYFRKYQLISLTNFGTAFGMGLVVVVFMIGRGYGTGAIVGLIGSVVGSIVSTRLMQHFVSKARPELVEEMAGASPEETEEAEQHHSEEEKTLFLRFLNSLLDGGKMGVELGMQIIPGVLIISTFVMMLTFGPSADGQYTGTAYEGVKLLPYLADKISFLFEWLFGFQSSELVSFPITALGAVGAALGLVPRLQEAGLIDGNAIAVFTAMGMCWSGYLSTHTAMLDSLGYRELTSKAIVSHTIGGLLAGIVAHWCYVGVMALASLTGGPSLWTAPAEVMCGPRKMSANAELRCVSPNKYVLSSWYDGNIDSKLEFSVDKNTGELRINNAYKSERGYYFVTINDRSEGNHAAYAAFYPSKGYSYFKGDEQGGQMYIWMFVYNAIGTEVFSGYCRVGWGDEPVPEKTDPDEGWD